MEYIRKIIYLQEYKSGIRESAKAGYARLEYRNRKWRLFLSPENTAVGITTAIYIIAERSDGCFAIYAGTQEPENSPCMILNRETGHFIDESKQLCGLRIGDEQHYLAGKCSDVKQELAFDKIKIWEQPKSANIVEKEKEKIITNFQSMYPFEDDEFDCCYQIEPRDIGYFPAASWHLSNNSFLLHGYYSYRHLLYACKQGKTYIGVPGQFHRREQYLASHFGFSHFKGTLKKRVTMGDFGYWMQELPH
jgi:hypothetical protein